MAQARGGDQAGETMDAALLWLWSWRLVVFAVVVTALLVLRVLVWFYFVATPEFRRRLGKSCLYVGRVKHTRFHDKHHHLDYPLFLSFIDLESIESLGWALWPIFKVDGGGYTFCSLDKKDHLKGELVVGESLYSRARAFITARTRAPPSRGSSVALLSHLTYFGYCFNPIGIYYVLPRASAGGAVAEIESVVAEVSNTPWSEMHCYMLAEGVEGVEISRASGAEGGSSRTKSRSKSRDRSKSGVRGRGTSRGKSPAPAPFTASSDFALTATWAKRFHVSPFMEMNYDYTFRFSTPGPQGVAVSSQMRDANTGKVAFVASFDLARLELTPLTLLYVLAFYPLHTRVIQVWIHIEAAKLWWKGVTFFPHPLGHDVDLGFGVTGERLGAVFGPPVLAVLAVIEWLRGGKKAKPE